MTWTGHSRIRHVEIPVSLQDRGVPSFLIFAVLVSGIGCSGANSGARERPVSSGGESVAGAAADHSKPIDWTDYGLLLSRVAAPDAIRWKALRQSTALIDNMLSQLSAKGPASTPAFYGDKSSRIAYYVNAHNLLFLAEISAVSRGAKVGRWPPTAADAMRVRIDGGIETVFSLRSKALDAGKEDWRVRMALFSGRRDGPPLWPRMLLSDMAEAQLDEITRVALESPRVVRIDHGLYKRLLLCDDIYDIQPELVAEYRRRTGAPSATILNVLIDWATPFNRETINSAVGYEVARLPRDGRIPLTPAPEGRESEGAGKKFGL